VVPVILFMHLAGTDTKAVTIFAECVLISHCTTLHYITITCLTLCAFIRQQPTLNVMN